MSKFSTWKKYNYLWITLGLFLFSIIGHWIFGWFAYVNDQETHNQPIDVGEYTIEMARDTLENWQSEFLQLMWQVAGLAFFFFVGSSQSKEGDDRKEEKLDYIIRTIDPKQGEEKIKKLDEKYARNS